MSINKFTINIEGDYVDSYIYSGLLILVDIDYKLTIYKWEQLFNQGLSGLNSFKLLALKSLILDSRVKIPKIELTNITISKRILNSAKLFTFDIGVWPSDINIFSNQLYISSEKGVSKLSLNYKDGSLSSEIKLFDEMCFSVSPNSHGRLAFAAGKSGVLTLLPLSKFHSQNHIKQLVSDVCVDLDWQSTKLFASTVHGVVEATFVKMPKQSDFKETSEFWNEVKLNKETKPRIERNTEEKMSWIAGDKKYSFLNNGNIKIGYFECEASTIETNFNDNILKARTAAFGTVLETDDELFSFIGNDIIPLGKEPVSWRVFPRAKNYANQLHIVQDEHIEITIIESLAENKFGFDTSKIDLQG